MNKDKTQLINICLSIMFIALVIFTFIVKQKMLFQITLFVGMVTQFIIIYSINEHNLKKNRQLFCGNWILIMSVVMKFAML